MVVSCADLYCVFRVMFTCNIWSVYYEWITGNDNLLVATNSLANSLLDQCNLNHGSCDFEFRGINKTKGKYENIIVNLFVNFQRQARIKLFFLLIFFYYEPIFEVVQVEPRSSHSMGLQTQQRSCSQFAWSRLLFRNISEAFDQF